MEFSVKSGSPEKQRSACIVVGVFEPRRLSSVAEQLDRISDGYLSALLRRGDLEGKAGQMLLLHQVPGVLMLGYEFVECSEPKDETFDWIKIKPEEGIDELVTWIFKRHLELYRERSSI